MGDDNSIQDTSMIPLYDLVKRIMYNDFETLKEYNAKIRVSRSNAERRELLIHFRETFLKFYDDVNDEAKIMKLDDDKKKKLLNFYLHPEEIHHGNCHIITTICRQLIHLLGITQIEYKKTAPGDAMSKGNR